MYLYFIASQIYFLSSPFSPELEGMFMLLLRSGNQASLDVPEAQSCHTRLLHVRWIQVYRLNASQQNLLRLLLIFSWWNLVFSFWGTSSAAPNISLLDAWYNLASGRKCRTASNIRTTPNPVTSPVSTGWFQEVATNDCAARWYTSSGWVVYIAIFSEDWSVRSPSRSVILSAIFSKRVIFGVLSLLIKPNIS